MMRAALYTRVSTEMQVQDGFSLDAQLSRLRAYCESQGWSVEQIYTDEGVSAKDLQRPALRRLLVDMKAKRFDVIVVYKLDRLTRSVRDLDDLLTQFNRYEVGFKSATEVYDTTSAMGRLFLHLVASLAQWERETIGERTRIGQEQMTYEGKWSGGHPPFGYLYMNGQLHVQADEAVIVRELFRRFTRGQSMNDILAWLNQDGLQSAKTPRKWNRWTLRYILHNPIYAGYVRYGYRTVTGQMQADFIVAKGVHEPIIDELTWANAEALHKESSPKLKHVRSSVYPLADLLYCGQCGSRMDGRTNKNGQRAVRYYVCRARKSQGCTMPMIQQSRIENAIAEQLQPLLCGTDAQAFATSQGNDKLALQHDVERLQKRRQRWMDAYEGGHVTASDLSARLESLDHQQHALKRRLDELQTSASSQPGRQVELLADFTKIWACVSSAQRRQLMHCLIRRIDVFVDGPIISRRPAPIRLELTFQT